MKEFSFILLNFILASGEGMKRYLGNEVAVSKLQHHVLPTVFFFNIWTLSNSVWISGNL